MMAASDDYVILRSGLSVPMAPIRLLLELERRNIRVWRDGDDVLIRPLSQVTACERDLIRRWKLHLLALIDYQADEHIQ